MRSVMLFAIRERADHPQFVGDDRHITQGAVELGNLAWNAAAKTYAMRVKAIGGFPFTYYVRVPDAFRLVKATASAGARVAAKPLDNGVLSVTVGSDKTDDVDVILEF